MFFKIDLIMGRNLGNMEETPGCIPSMSHAEDTARVSKVYAKNFILTDEELAVTMKFL